MLEYMVAISEKLDRPPQSFFLYDVCQPTTSCIVGLATIVVSLIQTLPFADQTIEKDTPKR